MKLYVYNFTRVVKGQVETKHVYAESLVEAKRKYKRDFKIDPDTSGFTITRGHI